MLIFKARKDARTKVVEWVVVVDYSGKQRRFKTRREARAFVASKRGPR